MAVLRPGMTVQGRRAKTDSAGIRINVYEGMGIMPTAKDARNAMAGAGHPRGGRGRKKPNLHRDNVMHRAKGKHIPSECDGINADRLFTTLRETSLRLDDMPLSPLKHAMLHTYRQRLAGLLYFEGAKGKHVKELLRLELARGCTRAQRLLSQGLRAERHTATHEVRPVARPAPVPCPRYTSIDYLHGLRRPG